MSNVPAHEDFIAQWLETIDDVPITMLDDGRGEDGPSLDSVGVAWASLLATSPPVKLNGWMVRHGVAKSVDGRDVSGPRSPQNTVDFIFFDLADLSGPSTEQVVCVVHRASGRVWLAKSWEERY